MDPVNLLNINCRGHFRKWLERHGQKETECWVQVKRGKPADDKHFWYIDAVEEALCFGWIDSTVRNINGLLMQRFTPRKPNSAWSALNKERARRLDKLGLMTDVGRKALPADLAQVSSIDTDIQNALENANVWKTFMSFPPLYQRVRSEKISFYKVRNPQRYKRMLSYLIEKTKQGKLYGQWDDYGRLTQR